MEARRRNAHAALTRPRGVCHASDRNVVGARYEIVGEVDAYGIARHSKAPADYITLSARPGIAGPEVVFESGITLEVALHGAGLPLRGWTLIDLNRGSEGPGPAGLDPAIYRKL